MDDLVYRQDAINALENTECELLPEEWDELTDAIMNVPPAQPEQQSRIEKELHGLTPKQQYNFLDRLMHKKSVGWNSTALYVIAWLNGEED